MRGGGRKAVVKVRIAKLKPGDLSAPRAHLRYIQRDSVGRNGEPGKLYGPERDEVDGGTFVDGCDGDRHQFRIIVSPDDGDQLSDLKPFVRDLMQQMERDLETKLDWVAVDHFNTGHPQPRRSGLFHRQQPSTTGATGPFSPYAAIETFV
jgi:type IV secretory pathway VirD2 relaxase